MIDGWKPGIGDPTPIGWITVISYLFAAFVCFLAAWSAKRADTHIFDSGRLWLMLGTAMIGLGINKQLDLQSLFTAIGRDIAHRQGWYAERRGVQEAFIVMIAISGAALLGLVAIYVRKLDWQIKVAGAGLTFLIIFIIVRAASFHHMDVLLGTAFVGIRLNGLLELGGIVAIAAGAIGYYVRFASPRHRSKSSE